ncbi:MAG TPA: hypothetical protein VLM85_24670 [Polyangiaceae bacterium]|nr:hypothetical protein [Polyangiaceae bacterium]
MQRAVFASWIRGASFVVMVAGLVAGQGCAEERPAINRVQVGAMDKRFFVNTIDDPSDDPEFYMRTTVVDVAAGAGSESLFTSSDAQTLVRIRWDITETELLARLTYELVQDTDYKGTRRVPDGQVVAAYAILKQFDIRRDYNPQTGEELNVIVENDTDRPWYQREYVRVDWSKNLVTDAYQLDTLSQIGINDGVKFDPIAYYVSDPNSPDAPVFDTDHGYFDVTNKAYASPLLIHDPDWGDIPACEYVGAFPMTNCNPSELTLRQSFLKVVDHDYEALDYDGTRMDMFGFFSDDRYGYDRHYGVVDDKWHRFAARWNIWAQSHATPMVTCANAQTTPVGASPHRDDDHDGTEDECASVGRGSKCDEFRGECTIPLRDRTVKTVPWYVNAGYPDELFDGSSAALDGWSEAIRVAVVAGRLAECRRTKDADCETTMGWPAKWSDDFSPPLPAAGAAPAGPNEVPKVFVLCHNPVDASKDDPACGANGLSPRLGDLRYNIVNLVASPQVASPWGIEVDAEDPLTGEKVSASVNQWGAVLDRAAATLVDLLGLINGDVDPTTYIQGQNVTDWVNANRPGGKASMGESMSADEEASRMGAFDPSALSQYSLGTQQKVTASKSPALRRMNRLQALVGAGRMGPGNDVLATRLGKLKGSQVEARMVSPSMAQAAGFDPTAPTSQQVVQRASPFSHLMNPTLRKARKHARRMGDVARHGCRIEATEPDNLLGLARYAATLFPAVDPKDKAAVQSRRDQIYLWARQQYSQGVYAHEMGHSMGLRHNFAATFDSLNYRNEYWQLRTKNGTVTSQCVTGTTDGSNCIGPRWRDPISTDEINGNIGRFATTSVMDYPGDQNHDQLLQGKYDKAAMRFGYGGVVDVWAQQNVSVTGAGTGQKVAYELSAFDQSPGLFGVIDFPPVDPTANYIHLHYSQYQKEFGLLGTCQADSSPGAIFGQKCSGQPMDIVDYRDMSDFSPDPSLAQYSWAVMPHAVDAQGRVRRGYMFSSDEYADSGNVPSFTYDAGADPYEQIRFLEAAYENRYILDAFRRNRTDFNSDAVIERTQEHYLDTIQAIAKTFSFGAVLDGDPLNPSTGFLDDGNYGPLAMGSSVALDLFGRILTRPDPGMYCDGTSASCAGIQPDGLDLDLFMVDSAPYPGNAYDFQLPLGTTGRYIHNDFDYGKGYWWADYQTQVGAYYDKIWATYYLSEAFDDFISNSKEDFTDGRYKNVNFATVYPEQVRRIFANILTGDYVSYAPWVTTPAVPNQTPVGDIVYPTWHDVTKAWTRPSSSKLVDPNYAFNEQLYAMVWGSIYFPTTWSRAWIDDARITALAGEQITWPANETYAFYNPKTGITYRAHTSGTETVFGDVHQKGIGARMLEWGNKLVFYSYQAYVNTSGGPVLNPDGTPKLILDSQGHPQLDPNAGTTPATLDKFVDNIDLMRQLTATFNQPLDDNSLPQP